MISVIVLSAGSGSRIGIPKYLLRYRERTFIEILYNNLCEIGLLDRIIVVCRNEYTESIRSIIGYSDKLHLVANNDYQYGMISSIYHGILNVDNDSSGTMIFPVDHALVSIETVSILCEKYVLNGYKNIIRPSNAEHLGHPIIIPNSVRNFIIENRFKETMREIIFKKYREICIDISSDDRMIRVEFNEKKDLSNRIVSSF